MKKAPTKAGIDAAIRAAFKPFALLKYRVRAAQRLDGLAVIRRWECCAHIRGCLWGLACPHLSPPRPTPACRPPS